MLFVKFCWFINITRLLTLFLTKDDRCEVSSIDMCAEFDRSLKLNIGLNLSIGEPDVDTLMTCEPMQSYTGWSEDCVPRMTPSSTLQNCRGPFNQYTGSVT